MKKRILPAILTLCMLLTLFPAAALAAEDESIQGTKGTILQDPGKTGGDTLTAKVEGDTITFGGEGETIAYYEADSSVGRNEAGNRVGVEISLPEGWTKPESGTAFTINLGEETEKTYTWDQEGLLDTNTSTQKQVIWYYPLVTDVAQTFRVTVHWSENSTQTFTIQFAEGTALEKAPKLEIEAPKTVGDTATGKITGNYDPEDTYTEEDGVTTEKQTITFDMTPESASASVPETIQITVSAETLTSIRSASDNPTVEIKTEAGSLTLDADAWEAITQNATTQDGTTSAVTLAIKHTENSNVYTLTATTEQGEEVYAAQDGGQNPGGRITVKIGYTMAANEPKVYYMGKVGYELVESQYDAKENGLIWTVEHFSDYRVIEGEIASIAAFGFQEKAEKANQAITDAMHAAGAPEMQTVTDADANTMYSVIKGTGTDAIYTVEVTRNGTSIHKQENQTIKGGSAIYFTFNREDHVGTEQLTGGQYTVTLSDEDQNVIATKTITIYSVGEIAEQWTQYIEDTELGSTIIPGSDMMYSQAPDIQTALSQGYSTIWAICEDEFTTDDMTETGAAALDAAKAALLTAVKTYTLFLLDTAYHEGNGYEVNGTIYYMPEQAYQAAKAAITNATEPQNAMAAFQNANNAQYAENSVHLFAVGFESVGADANEAINTQIAAMGGPESAYVSDSDRNTMYLAIMGSGQEGTYQYKVVNEQGAVVESGTQAVTNGAVVYFSFDAAHYAGAPLAAGVYTVQLFQDGWTDPINTLTLTLGELSFDVNGGTPDPIDALFATVGDNVTLPTVRKSGFRFQGWSDGTKTYQGIMAMPAGATNLTAKWAVSTTPGGGGGGSTTYSITTAAVENGTVTTSVKNAVRGSTVTITVTPDEGYELESLAVINKNGTAVNMTDAGNGKYTFTMPASSVTVKAVFKAISKPELPFTDLVEGAWYYDAVKYVYESGMMGGTSGSTFSPDMKTSRGMVVTILYRLEGEPAVSSSNSFADVASGTWYTDAVAWAAENGIVNGYDTGLFGPDDAITREQLAAILYRYAAYKGYDLTSNADLSGYIDADQISNYAQDAMQWANLKGLIIGTSGVTLTPDGLAARVEVATILMRLCENVAK